MAQPGCLIDLLSGQASCLPVPSQNPMLCPSRVMVYLFSSFLKPISPESFPFKQARISTPCTGTPIVATPCLSQSRLFCVEERDPDAETFWDCQRCSTPSKLTSEAP
jgi:hypothetical protein